MPEESSAQRLSDPIEELLASAPSTGEPMEIDTLIVGSGYGAAMAALVLGKQRHPDPRIWVFERGREVVPGEFPKTVASLPREFSVTTKDRSFGEHDALWDIRQGEGITAVVARGVGGGSLTNANVAYPPRPEVLASWPGEVDWAQALAPSVREVQQLLNAAPATELAGSRKFAALRSTASALGASCAPVQLTVQQTSGPNAVGVEQHACTRCGNCISGCNIGAKGSLDMNAWPLARTLGVKVYSGVTVRSLQRITGERGARWRVFARSTYDDRVGLRVDAREVILAAGTFGSTEILDRSGREHGLTLSDWQLGRRFSGNGDVLTYTEGQKDPVDAVATAPSDEADRSVYSVGPTIIGAVDVAAARHEPPRDGSAPRSRAGSEHPRFLLEDSAAPYPTRRFLEEVLVTRNLIRRFQDGRLPPWQREGEDPVAATLQAGRHHQLLLAMADDGARGRLEPSRAGGFVGTWPADPGAREFFTQIRDALGAADAARGRGAPRDTSSPIRELDHLDNAIVTVHPLGGCCMASRAEDGVVNEKGAVFSGSHGTDTHPGLYVFDGSIVPGALGFNPFLTIAALAHYLAGQIPPLQQTLAIAHPHLAALVHPPAPPTRVATRWQKRAAPRAADPVVLPPNDETIRAHISERFYLRLGDPRSRERAGKILRCNLSEARALVLDVRVEVKDAFAWLARPGQPLPATYRWFESRIDFGDTVPTTALQPIGDPHTYQGSVIYGGLDSCQGRPLTRLWRQLGAGWSFAKSRSSSWRWRVPARRDSRPLASRLRGWGRHARGLWRISAIHADYRFIHYSFAGPGVHFEGNKWLRYRGPEPDPLETLRALPFELRGHGNKLVDTLRVDVLRLTGASPAVQVEHTPDTITTGLALGGAFLFLARGILQSLLWSFRRPDYDDFPSPAEASSPRLGRAVGEGAGATPSGWLTKPADDGSPLGFVPGHLRYRDETRGGAAAIAWAEDLIQTTVGSPPNARAIRLTHYVPEGKRSAPKSALLIHGLACGSRAFWTETVDTPLAQYLLGHGYDVWLLDHSLSVNLHEHPCTRLALDDLAKEDIPWALRTASAEGRHPVHVFAHCAGAAVFAMSVLGGHLSAGGRSGVTSASRSGVASAALHAVAPWLMGSEDNAMRANLLSLFKDVVADDFDPIPHRAPDRLDTFYDALASSVAWGKDRKRHCEDEQAGSFSRTICNRMTLFYGREWPHDNLDPRTHQKLDTIVGPGSLKAMLQSFFCVERGRLTDHHGDNVYVLAENFDSYWDFRTLFLHGDQNQVFHVESARRSARELELLHQTAATERNFEAAQRDPEGYLRQRAVSLLVCQGIGHMDMVLGKTNHLRVFPHVREFFEGKDFKRGNIQPLSVTQPAAEAHPIAGPIISRPRLDNKAPTLRVWMATSELAASPPLQVSLGRPLPAKIARDPAAPPATQGTFWLGDVSITPATPGPVARVLYPTLGRQTPKDFVAMPGAPLAERQPTHLEWRTLPWFRRAFEPEARDGSLSFALGSCLYPGFSTEQELSDRIFKRMEQQVRAGAGPRLDHVLLVGDQIYADALGEAFPTHSPLERYRNRYRRAFGGVTAEVGKSAHWVFANVPTYFAIDDHEIANDWASDGGPLTETALAALDEAYNFQMHHDERCFYYSFESLGFPFFVLDTRSERRANVSRDDADALMSGQQRNALASWLRKHGGPSAEPLFIASGTALAPLTWDVVTHPALALRSDGLIGFPGFLKWLHDELRHIERPIVWLAGDLHCSTICTLELEVGDKTVRWLQVCGSGLFAPLPFANTSLQSFAAGGAPVSFAGSGLRLAATHEILIRHAQASFVQVTTRAGRLEAQAIAGAPGTDGQVSAWDLQSLTPMPPPGNPPVAPPPQTPGSPPGPAKVTRP